MDLIWLILIAAAVAPLLLAIAATAGTLLVLELLSLATNPGGHRPMTTTPTTRAGLEQYDDLQAVTAVILAWTEPGPHPAWHEDNRADLRRAMPVLGRALDRLAAEGPQHPTTDSAGRGRTHKTRSTR